MKSSLILCVLIGASIAADTSFYTTADDNLDMESLIKDPERAEAYLDCFLGKKPCDAIAASYLRIIPDSIRTGCKRCNPLQKHLANTFLSGLRVLMPAKYEEFVKKFDPKGIYMENFLQKVKGY
ncbi:ejaculatory bulb-specific protein 3-like [Zerene cesonia]|uniref:ejaculatory bulb-specific protein 3-like n=1 Tax=Zerene cesonia TaxID=33412 RepID=UPI0018E55700|nr:ejaculatory bulb-specific protein 3-like [Zerene cesonia]